MELIYYPTTTNQFGYKNPQPDNVIGVDIQDLGNDKELYRYNFLIKNHRHADDYTRFITFAKTFSLSGTQLDQQTRLVMDVDQWLRTWALVTLCGVSDSYTFGNNHNLLIYLRPSDQRFLAFPVDMDFSFVRAPTSSLVGDQNFSKIINRPANLRAFYAHVLDIISSTYNPSYMSSWIRHYNSFLPEQSFSGVSSYLQSRANHATNTINSAGGYAPFNVTGTNFVTSNNLVTLAGTAPVQVQTIKVNGGEYPVTWTSVSAWTMRVPVSARTNVLTLEGYDLYGKRLTNYTRIVTVVYTQSIPEPRDLVILNEIMYHPASPDAAFVELFNTSPAFSFDLSGWRVDGLGFTFPPGSVIAGGQYLVLAGNLPGYAAAYGPSTPPPFAQFAGNLRNTGEILTLLRPGMIPGQEIVVDQVRYESAPPWPTDANGLGPSLQLIDPAQDNSRTANWAAVQTSAPPAPEWVYFFTSGTASSSTLYIYLQSAGSIYIDDLKLVPGSVPEVGTNMLANGSFESSLSGSWVVSQNLSQSARADTINHSGNYSLHIIATTGGSTKGSSIYQEISPALAQGQPYTLSFWYLQSTNGGPLVLRLSGSGVAATINPAQPHADGLQFTPGTVNTWRRSLPAFPSLWLNEVQLENLTGLPDNWGQRDPWIELYNAGANAVSLDGFYLSSTYTNLAQWAFPSNASIGPGQFRVIWADGQTNQTIGASPHTSFRLNSSSGAVVLSRATTNGLQLLDYLKYTGVAANQSYGDLPDGQPFYRQTMYLPTPGATNSGMLAPITVLINEWSAANNSTSGIADPADGMYQDWFELYNTSRQVADLEGYYLSDSLTNRFLSRIPAGYVVAPGGRLLVWADDELEQNATNRADLHVKFKLDQDGEAIVLSAQDGTVIDAIVFGPQTNNVSQGRYPDGAGQWYFMPTPTPRLPNMIPLPSPPELLGLSLLGGGTVEFRIRTIPNRSYRIEYTEDLTTSVWVPLGGDRVATGTELVLKDSMAEDPCRFYRAVLLP
jgi:hypothetical protein